MQMPEAACRPRSTAMVVGVTTDNLGKMGHAAPHLDYILILNI